MIALSPSSTRIETIEAFAACRDASALVWAEPRPSGSFDDTAILQNVEDARHRFERFAPVLAQLFPIAGWDGRITSPLIRLADDNSASPLWAKCDHALPIAGSVKARGGIHEVLKYVEAIAGAHGIGPDDPQFVQRLLDPAAKSWMATHHLLVGSTGNLGYGVGVAARAFGLAVEVHMSSDAKTWKKERLRSFGVNVVEHDGDFTEAVAEARRSAANRPNCHFVDDENSRDLLTGYAVAARELADQLEDVGVCPAPDAPLVVYVPCGVGGAAGGIAIGLKAIFGMSVRVVIVEPLASPCMMAARLNGDQAVPVYNFGRDNRTIADGLAVPCASQLVLDVAAHCLDTAVAISDETMTRWARQMWTQAGLRLEPSAAAGFAAREPLRSVHPEILRNATELVWTTGGQLMPDAEFHALIGREINPTNLLALS